jgi:8-oxo-dGTP pyrophosphatase MutT (NUDIX family)
MARLIERIRAAHAFDADRFLPFEAGGPLGWIRRDFIAHLRRWSGVFEIEERGVRLRAGLASEPERTAALAEVARGLAEQGMLSAWRNETYAARIQPHDEPLFHIERAAMRFFGLTSTASHLNGFVRSPGGLRVWIARRSATKSIDPGRLDTLVGGGIPSGQDAWQALVRECHEEAGIDEGLATKSRAAGALEVCHEVPEGLHSEILYTHDLELAPDFQPRNVDGEVSQFMSQGAEETADDIASGEFTIEAGLVTLDFLSRQGVIPLDGALASALDRCRVRP